MDRPDISPAASSAEEPRADYSPEARRRAVAGNASGKGRLRAHLGPGSRAFELAKRVVSGSVSDGMIHAGNLAYMAMLAIFPFFITGAAVFSLIGEASERAAMIDAFMTALPPVVRAEIEPVARNVVEMRTGWLLWIGGFFGLWTVGSLVETIRDILRRAYGTPPAKAFWKYRLASTGIILASVLLLILSLIAQVMISTAQEIIGAFFPELHTVLRNLGWSRIVAGAGLFGSIYLLFRALTPPAYGEQRYPKWPGALLVTLWWVGVSLALPQVLRLLLSFDLTYGSLAGMMIALFFFWLVGLGVVAGAELNAALAETPEEERNRLGRPAKANNGPDASAKEDNKG